MRALFIRNTDAKRINFNQIEENGATDIFANGIAPSSDYNGLVSQLKNIQTKLDSTNLKLWSDFPPLYHNGWKPPTDTNKKDVMAGLVENLLTEPDINLEGISFDDYDWHPSIWPHAKAETTPNSTEEKALTTFAGDMCEITQSYGKKLICNGPSHDDFGVYVPNLSLEVDYYAPQIYKNHTYSICNTDNWVAVELQAKLNDSINNNIIPCLITYNHDTDSSLRTREDVEGQIRTVLKYVDDYILFEWHYFDEPVRFLRRSSEIWNGRLISSLR